MSGPRSRWAAVLAWGLCTLTLAIFVALVTWTRDGPADGEAETEQVATLVVFGLLVVSFAVVGAVVASRVPRNAIGWLCSAMGLLPSIGAFGDEYVLSALGPDALPGAGYVAATQTLWNAFLALPALLLLLFPTGSPPGRRWRVVLITLVAAMALVVLADLVKPGTQYEGLANPLAIGALRSVLPVISGVGSALLVGAALAGFVSLVFRYRRANTEERQQLKLLAYSLALIGLGFAVAAVFESTGHPEISNAFISGSLISIPVSIGFAVLKHGLYDIDVIINRTIVYAALTAILGSAYVGLVFGLQALLAPFTSESDLAVAGSTLGVAALFRPIRNVVQGFIDRRFYRRRFDAQRTLEEFSTSLRDQVDLGELSLELESVVRETMQPTHVSLWLRPAPGGTP